MAASAYFSPFSLLPSPPETVTRPSRGSWKLDTRQALPIRCPSDSSPGTLATMAIFRPYHTGPLVFSSLVKRVCDDHSLVFLQCVLTPSVNVELSLNSTAWCSPHDK